VTLATIRMAKFVIRNSRILFMVPSGTCRFAPF
jgi:hypothetical protein